MNPTLSSEKKNDKKKEDPLFAKWTPAQEELLAEWSEKATCFRWLHSRSEKLYRTRNYSFTIPVIILSTLTGTANFAMDSFVPEENKQVAMACVGGVNIFAGILSTLQNFLRYAELMESHRLSEVQWSKFSRNISVELALDPRRRKPANDFLKICRAEYDRLIESSPTIDDSIIKQFKYNFKKTDIIQPDICNGLHKCKIYKPSKEEKLEEVMSVAGAKLLEKRKSKKWNVNLPMNKIEDNDELKSIFKKEDKESSRKELDELKSVGRVSSFKNKLQDIEKDIEENETNSPMDAINKIVESIDVEDKKIETIVEEKISEKDDDNKSDVKDEEDDIEKNICDKCNHEVDKELKESENLEKECKEFLDGIDDKENEDEI